MPPFSVRLGVYGAIGLAVIGPAIASGGVPGAPRSDLWNSLWSFWRVTVEGLGARTTLLDHPAGGVLLVADPVNALLFAPVTALWGAAAAWTVAVFAHVVFAGAAADRLARDLGADRGGALVAGAAFASAPLLLSSVHNGTSESIGWGWLPLAVLVLRVALRRRTAATSLGAVAALALAALSSPYLAVATWIAAAVTVLSSESRRPAWLRGALVLGAATLVSLPWFLAMHATFAAPDNLVGIKDGRELLLVRRTIGGADPLSFIVPGEFRSPDFRRISRYGEDFVHAPYLGWAWLVAAGVGLRRSGRLDIAAWGLVGLLLACGPVLVHEGTAVLLPGDLGIPLPYFLLEPLPGFASLSLVYRLAVLGSLAVALLASLAVSGRAAWALALVGLLEIAWLSPMAGGPAVSPLPDEAPFRQLAEGPAGAVMNFPVEGGRSYLYEQTLHARALAGTLNFPANDSAKRVWASLRDAPGAESATQAARRAGIRWLVVHDDALVAPGPYDAVVSDLEQRQAPYASGEGVRIHRLW